MRIFYSEFQNDYSSYTFSYAPYCIFESIEKMDIVYDSGFLPYTGDPGMDGYIYYMARSLRVVLSEFELSSENRRVIRKFENFPVDRQWIEKKDFGLVIPEVRSFWLRFCEVRFRNGKMDKRRLDYILKSPFVTGMIRYSVGDVHVGDVLISHHGNILHYWFSFYELEKYKEFPLGKFLMLDVIRQCKEKGLSYVYLGTCYGVESLYKVRDFKGIEYFDGMGWRKDVEVLKEWCRGDGESLPADRFKMMASTEQQERVFGKGGQKR